ncbi:MAG: NAD(+)/NADH kinase [Fimbriimonadaceae bacterium]|nr:NAD(+)/NADH kinase [Fimbriimonadaceae bacterium]
MQIHLLVNNQRSDALDAARETVAMLISRGVGVGADHESASLLGVDAVALEAFSEADLVITFGGDGTLIRAANACSERGTPILGVYYGRFGFVTQCSGSEIGACLSDFFDGRALLEERMMLHTELLRAGSVIASLHSLNEISLQRDVTARMMTFRVTVDGRNISHYPADGVMVSTPTGSTGYSLSAGGPIVDPVVRAILVTAIAPHTLSVRPLVLGPDSVVELAIETEGDAILSGDGQTRLHLLSGDLVKVRRSTRVTRLIRLEKDDFLIKLRERLLWGRRLPDGWGGEA